MNELEYDYIPLDLPNVLAKVRKDRIEPEEGSVFFINEFIAPLILELAKKQPHWQLISDDYTSAGRGKRFTRFVVYHNRVSLGKLYTEHRGGTGNVFSIQNTRISKGLQRSSSRSRTTKDLAKAINIVIKNFRSDTTAEALEATLEYTRTQLNRQHAQTQSDFDDFYRRILWKLQPEIMSKWQETYRDLAARNGADINTIESIEEAFNKNKLSLEVRRCEAINGGAVVLIRGDEYIVSNGLQSTNYMQLHSTDTLPIGLKRAVGLLKLAPENEIISGVGIKVRENTFYVIATEKTNE